MTTVIKNGTLLDASGERKADLYLQDGKIIGENLALEADEVIDATGLTVTPAFIDLHTHLREPGQTEKEDLTSGLNAASAGGVGTTVSTPAGSPHAGRAASGPPRGAAAGGRCSAGEGAVAPARGSAPGAGAVAFDTTVPRPPALAAFRPLVRSSFSVWPGSRRWVCRSMSRD